MGKIIKIQSLFPPLNLTARVQAISNQRLGHDTRTHTHTHTLTLIDYHSTCLPYGTGQRYVKAI